MRGIAESAPERRPYPAYREPEARQRAIRGFVRALLDAQPDLFEDMAQLTTPPPVNQRALDEGYGPYGHNYVHNTWNWLASFVVATEDEIRSAYEVLNNGHGNPKDHKDESASVTV